MQINTNMIMMLDDFTKTEFCVHSRSIPPIEMEQFMTILNKLPRRL